MNKVITGSGTAWFKASSIVCIENVDDTKLKFYLLGGHVTVAQYDTKVERDDTYKLLIKALT